MRKFVSGSIYVLMAIIVFFIFYKTATLLVFVVSAVYLHFQWLGWMSFAEMQESSRQSIRIAEQILNIVTFILVLVKSFKILVSYSRKHHIAIKDLVEISIIALLMEVVFNFWIHSMKINILFSILWVALVIAYGMIPYFRLKPKKRII